MARILAPPFSSLEPGLSTLVLDTAPCGWTASTSLLSVLPSTSGSRCTCQGHKGAPEVPVQDGMAAWQPVPGLATSEQGGHQLTWNCSGPPCHNLQ